MITNVWIIFCVLATNNQLYSCILRLLVADCNFAQDLIETIQIMYKKGVETKKQGIQYNNTK